LQSPGTVLSLNRFLMVSSESGDVLVTGTRGKQNPNTGRFLFDNKQPAITTSLTVRLATLEPESR